MSSDRDERAIKLTKREIKRMATILANLTTANSNGDYALGYTNSEHERLIRQATQIAPYTERLFREAGIGPGQRVLDLGSGVGDVSMLLARIVGPRAKSWASSATPTQSHAPTPGWRRLDLRNISFTEADVNQIVSDQPFDAAAGRFILMFLPDPASVLRSLTQLVRPGGILAFHECSWVPFLAFAARFPLLSKLLSAIHETFLRAGVNPEMGIALYQSFSKSDCPRRPCTWKHCWEATRTLPA